jgi:two-component system LytT family response regulator
MTPTRIRVVVADDERPARLFLLSLLKSFAEVTVVGQASNGAEAVQLIERHQPDVALLDLQMPELEGLDVVRLVRRKFLPLIVFVTAHDEYAVEAFELNAVDYVTKPVTEARLREAFRRVRERMGRSSLQESAALQVQAAAAAYHRLAPNRRLDRIPVRRKDDIVFVPATQVSSCVAEGELLHLTTAARERHTITYRLKDLEARLDPARFIRLSRGTLANVDHIVRVTPAPGGVYTVTMKNGEELDVSRIQARVLRGRLLQL